MDDLILDIRGLGVSFLKKDAGRSDSFFAVKNLSLQVRRNSFTSIVGESGSGKSVTALSVAKLIRPFKTSGRIYFKNEKGALFDLTDLTEKELLGLRGREIAYVFQDPGSSLNPVMTIGEQLAEAYEAHAESEKGAGRKKALAFLNLVKIRDAERVYASFPHQVSGGMKQRTMIAMALLTGARLLIADEPTTALDAETELGIMSLLAELKKERNLTVLFITHNLPLALFYSDEIYVMEKGELAERLTKTDQFKHTSAYARKLFSAQLEGTEPKSYLEVSS